MKPGFCCKIKTRFEYVLYILLKRKFVFYTFFTQATKAYVREMCVESIETNYDFFSTWFSLIFQSRFLFFFSALMFLPCTFFFIVVTNVFRTVWTFHNSNESYTHTHIHTHVSGIEWEIWNNSFSPLFRPFYTQTRNCAMHLKKNKQTTCIQINVVIWTGFSFLSLTEWWRENYKHETVNKYQILMNKNI